MDATISFGKFYCRRNAEGVQVDFALANRWAVQGEVDRLAGEIYDGLTQHFSAIRRQLVVARELIASNRGNPLGHIQRAIELANLGLAETRRCVHNLRRGVVDESGLRETLQGWAERSTGEKCECSGLGNMKKRTREIDERFEIKTAPGKGTNIIVTAPLHDEILA